MRALLALCCAVALGGCAIVINPNDGDVRYVGNSGGKTIDGNQQRGRDERPVSSVTALDIGNLNWLDVRIDVRVGPAPSLVIEADSNLLPLIHSEASGNTLRIWSDANLRRSNEIRITYTTPHLNKISITSGGRLVASGFNGEDLSLEQRGSLKTELSGKVGRLDLANHGSGTINAVALASGNSEVVQNGSGRIHLGQVRGERVNIALNGSGNISASAGSTVQRLDAKVNGSGDIDLASLRSETAYLASNGSGDIDATASGEVNARSSGSGRITVHGEPAKRTLSGSRVRVVQ
ncbi:head GIN domain-containing protein [Janthinobacterium psychrotolerans]|uniref:Putative auto-transporter adhesin, head GIN domain n=1 Tax=Janthinobacterium psychrotolerans TaxID=1747903 RepID=A0A1A7C456_9BURK|nr:head GIN domain-containing protein [Janthinobacterium psychrotolerans]OBV40492.1 putative auto-transporter adhesin, head GIN domain [Janthinobacterium psychrotolerans]